MVCFASFKMTPQNFHKISSYFLLIAVWIEEMVDAPIPGGIQDQVGQGPEELDLVGIRWNPCPWQGGWNCVIFSAPSNQTILWEQQIPQSTYSNFSMSLRTLTHGLGALKYIGNDDFDVKEVLQLGEITAQFRHYFLRTALTENTLWNLVLVSRLGQYKINGHEDA